MNTSLRVLRYLIFILLCFANLSSIRLTSLGLEDSYLRQVHFQLEDSFSPVFPVQHALINNVEICLHLADGDARVTECHADSKEEIWRSPENWQVREGFFSDLDRDGGQELVLLVWRPFKPWPVDRYLPVGGRINTFKNKDGESCHLILMSLDDEEPEEIWAGSALENPLRSLIAVDMDGNGLLELAALEYLYDDAAATGPVVLWQWNGFGFSLVDRAEGAYTSLHALTTNSSVILLALDD